MIGIQEAILILILILVSYMHVYSLLILSHD